MKHQKTTFLFALIIFSFTGYGQSAERKNHFSLGSGKQSYRGDLGSAWFKPDEEYYAFGSLAYSRYLTKSFDVSGMVTHGDYGHCREEDESIYRPDGTEVLNMLSRLTSIVVSAKYKFANGYVLKQHASFAPYVYLGAGMNNISEFWWKNKTRANPGNYASLNGGLGASYSITKKINLTYNLGFGYFTTDKIDFRSEGKNDMVMQHTIMVGISF